MTDNEKRAHDLAILATKCLFEMKHSDDESHKDEYPFDQKDFSFDTFGEYEKAYYSYLERLNRTSN